MNEHLSLGKNKIAHECTSFLHCTHAYVIQMNLYFSCPSKSTKFTFYDNCLNIVFTGQLGSAGPWCTLIFPAREFEIFYLAF